MSVSLWTLQNTRESLPFVYVGMEIMLFEQYTTSAQIALTFWRRNYFFLILAHTVYKMWIIQEPNKLELWNKLHFEEKKTESIHHV